MILVTGSSGLLGSHLCARYPKDTMGYTRREFDVTDESQILSILSSVRPDVVVNCAGITRTHNEDPYQVYLVNTVAPRQLAFFCDELKIRFVHISTNCVFSNREGGMYKEYEQPDAKDIYGRTKAQGEVYEYEYSDSLNIRTSLVGWPDPSGRGLLAWLRRQPVSKPVMGYRNVLWNGLTTTALCDYIIELAYSRLSGVVHLTGQTISKYQLLSTVNELFGWGYTIEPVDVPVENKTLDNTRKLPYLPGTYNFQESVAIMRNQGMKQNATYHGHYPGWASSPV